MQRVISYCSKLFDCHLQSMRGNQLKGKGGGVAPQEIISKDNESSHRSIIITEGKYEMGSKIKSDL